MITNADQGVVVSWRDFQVPTYSYWREWDSEGNELGIGDSGPAPESYPWKLTTVSGGVVTGEVAAANLPDQDHTPQPVLQREDGSYLGYLELDAPQMIAFSASGSILWLSPTNPDGWADPLYALADGGMIYRQYTNYGTGGYQTRELIQLSEQGEELSRVTDSGYLLSGTQHVYN
ncbi:MAG TPA: hypothetical protein VN577_18425 [Terriglobales bacterium]|nr:hypothetical protein [Terriglobales bacterium]